MSPKLVMTDFSFAASECIWQKTRLGIEPKKVKGASKFFALAVVSLSERREVVHPSASKCVEGLKLNTF